MNLELFQPTPHPNLLPVDGVVQDYGLILDTAQAQCYFEALYQGLAWQHDEVMLYGKYFKTARKIAWYGDEEYHYQYSGMQKQAHDWHPLLRDLKHQIEGLTGHQFNSCLANLYEDGTQGMGWHRDDEASLRAAEHETVIASLSLGATRKFRFKHIHTDAKVDLMLHSGQLIVMKGQTQRYWKHMLAKSSKVQEPRINLTFRYFYPHTSG